MNLPKYHCVRYFRKRWFLFPPHTAFHLEKQIRRIRQNATPFIFSPNVGSLAARMETTKSAKMALFSFVFCKHWFESRLDGLIRQKNNRGESTGLPLHPFFLQALIFFVGSQNSTPAPASFLAAPRVSASWQVPASWQVLAVWRIGEFRQVGKKTRRRLGSFL